MPHRPIRIRREKKRVYNVVNIYQRQVLPSSAGEYPLSGDFNHAVRRDLFRSGSENLTGPNYDGFQTALGNRGQHHPFGFELGLRIQAAKIGMRFNPRDRSSLTGTAVDMAR